MATASRTSGIAPLYVAFDAVDASSGVVSPTDGDYHSLHYTWDFGDPSAGQWATSGKSKNFATGFVAGHLYENPGNYDITLRVRKADGTTNVYTQSISVQGFSGTTYYVSASGSDSYSGTSQNSPFRTVAKAATVAGANVRLRFRRGDTFAASSSWAIDRSGPVLVDSYGSGAAPVIHWPSPTGGLVISGNGQGSDWRFVGIHFKGTGQDYTISQHGLIQYGRMQNNLFVGCKFTHWHTGVVLNEVSTSTLATGSGFVENEFSANAYRGIWFGGFKVGLLGNRMVDHQQTRIFHASRSVVSHNDMQGGQLAPNGNTLKCQGSEWLGPVRNLVISDNIFGGNDGGPWPVEVAPQNNTVNEPMQDIIIERNVFRGNSTTQAGLILAARNVVVRNNIFIATGMSPWFDAVSIFRRGYAPVPDNVRVYNNTTFRGDSSQNIVKVRISAEVTNTHVANNSLSAPATASRAMLVGSGSGLVYDEAFNKIVATSAFVNPGGGDFTPSSGSELFNTGQSLPLVRDDFKLIDRPQQGEFDIGAVERMGP